MYFLWDFSGSPVDRTWHFHWGDPGSIPGPEIKILQAVRCTTPKIYFFFFSKIYFLNNKALKVEITPWSMGWRMDVEKVGIE